MQTAAKDLLVGRSLEGRYRILERIARGGMSTVYAAVDERLDRLVAVKVMSAALSSDPAFSDRFAREARAAARLTHLNAVCVYDQGHELGPDGHHVFLVMELVEGRTLRELLRDRGRLDVAEAVSIMEPVLSALSAAHRAGLVHRDVKPENILLSDDGVVKVADFGLARAVETDAASTRTGLMMGTVAYCAPEQIANGSADPRSDVYAAGVVFFELLTGEPPFRGESAMNVAYQHVHSRVPAPSSRVRAQARIPSEVDELVIAATDRDPTGRPADASAFLAEIADIRVALALPVTPVPARPRPPRGARAEPGIRRPPSMESATTSTLYGPVGGHDTAIDPQWAARTQARRAPTSYPDGAPRAGVGPARYPGPAAGANGSHPRYGGGPPRTGGGPPPPVVIPPPRGEVKSDKPRRHRVLIVLLVLVLVGAAAGGGTYWFMHDYLLHVPRVTGDPQLTAAKELEQAGYHVRTQGPVFSPSVPKGAVISTDPGTGTRLSRGKVVVMLISAGPHLYPVKSVRSQSVEQAREILTSAGLTVAQQVRQEYDDTVPEGEVTRTSPKAGTQIRTTQPITIYASKGPPVVDVPTVSKGSSLADVKAVLKHAHFKTQTDEQYSDDVPAGLVISLNPSGRAVKFSRITIEVSKGPEMVTVPNIAIGTAAADAARALRDVGLVAKVLIVGGGVRAVPGDVLTLDPGAGERVHTGAEVIVYTLPA